MEWTNEDDVNCGNLNEDRRIQAMGSNPIEVPKFFRVNLQLFKLQLPLAR